MVKLLVVKCTLRLLVPAFLNAAVILRTIYEFIREGEGHPIVGGKFVLHQISLFRICKHYIAVSDCVIFFLKKDNLYVNEGRLCFTEIV